MFEENKPAFGKILSPYFMILAVFLILAIDGANVI